jgi:diadenosine tetraphosphatase ApaH/serine/threonine PP2A family protein phosphatase
MRIALFSDIHGNREALGACLARAERDHPDHYAFLGDVVGYGADPAWCLDTVAGFAGRGAIVLLGNHDEAVFRPTMRMNEAATRAVDWTRGRLDAAQLDFLRHLPLTEELEGVLFVHASGWRPDAWNYVIEAADAERSLEATPHALTFCGHTHVPALFRKARSRPALEVPVEPGGAVVLKPTQRWLGVIPAVGQPRDDNPAAGYALFDTDRCEVTFERVAYDIDKAARKIREAGLPDSLWMRLFLGR